MGNDITVTSATVGAIKVYTLTKTVDGATSSIVIKDHDADGLDNHDGFTVTGDTSIFTSTEIQTALSSNAYRSTALASTIINGATVTLPAASYTNVGDKVKITGTDEYNLGSLAAAFGVTIATSATSSTTATSLYNTVPNLSLSSGAPGSTYPTFDGLDGASGMSTFVDPIFHSGDIFNKYLGIFSALALPGVLSTPLSNQPVLNNSTNMYTDFYNYFLGQLTTQMAANTGSTATNLAATNTDLTATNTDLTATNTDLTATNTDLTATNTDLTATNTDLTAKEDFKSTTAFKWNINYLEIANYIKNSEITEERDKTLVVNKQALEFDKQASKEYSTNTIAGPNALKFPENNPFTASTMDLDNLDLTGVDKKIKDAEALKVQLFTPL